jgi:hypothetical protein
MAIEQQVYNKPKFKKIFGLIEYRPKWSLTLRGWGVLLAIFIAVFSFVLTHLQPFLAYSQPNQDADILVVEGWLDDEAVKGALAEFKRGDYQLLVTTGIPILRGSFLSEYKNFAELCASTLVSLGADRSKLAIVPTPEIKRDRTLASAIAFGKWFSESNLSTKSINLYSYDVHTRRSWLLFRRVLPSKINIGAIAYPAISYDRKKWWASSEGIRTVISETIGYIYARFVKWN